MGKLTDIQTRALREMLGTRNLSTAGLGVANGTSSKVDSANAIATIINGAFCAASALNEYVLTAKAALQNPITHQDTFYVQPVSTTVYYVFVIDAADNVYTIQGTYSGQVLASDRGPRGDGSIPRVAVPDTYAVLGAVKVETDSTHTFTPATTGFDAAGITDTWYDWAVLPS